MFRGESQHQHQQEIPTRCSTTEPSGPRSRPPRWSDFVALGGPTVASVDSKSAAAPSQRGPNNENYDPPMYTPTSRPVYDGTPANPLVREWGVYQGLAEMSWMPYLTAGAEQQALLDKIVQRPKATWFGHWQPDGDITDRVRKYIELTTGGDPDVLVQTSIFRMDPWELEACKRLPTAAEQASYKTWIDGFVAGVGDAHMAVIMQPDGSVRALRARRLEGAGEADQVRRPQAQRAAQHERLHRRRGGRLEPRRPEEGVADAHPDGHPLGPRVRAEQHPLRLDRAPGAVLGRHRQGALGHAGSRTSSASSTPRRTAGPSRATSTAARTSTTPRACRSQQDKRCVTLGIPPTVDVGDPKWGLNANDRRLAETVRRRLPVVRPPLALQPGRPVPARPGAGAGPHHALLTGTT